jgi:molybdenum cofactor cytidylyltransferase
LRVNDRLFSLAAILLAAGRSTRMGKPKLLLPWAETSVLGHLIAGFVALEADLVAVVCAADDLPVRLELDRLSFPDENRVINPDPSRGMFSSIVCAARWAALKPAITHWAIVLGDQPHLQHDTFRQLIDFARKHPEQVCQPSRNGKRGHPVVLPRGLFLEIAASQCGDLKEFLANHPVAECECDDAGLDLDIDRPEDYRKALSLAGLGGGST